MQSLINNLLARAGTQSRSSFTARWAVLSAYDPSTFSVKATLQPEDVETGFMPLLSPWVGPNWGAFFAPDLGAQLLVLFQEGGAQAPIGALFAFSTVMPPLAVQSGEMLIQHASGSLLHFDNGGNVTLSAAAAATINAPGGLTINANTTINGNTQNNGNVQASGSIADLNAAHGSMGSLRAAYDGHTHPGVQTGSGSTGTTSAPV